jgi:hypothetical protein
MLVVFYAVVAASSDRVDCAGSGSVDPSCVLSGSSNQTVRPSLSLSAPTTPLCAANELLDYCQTDAGAAAATRATAIRPVEAFENVRE